VVSPDLKVARSRHARLPFRRWLARSSAPRRSASFGGGAVALSALFSLATSCLASEPSPASSRPGTADVPIQRSASDRRHNFVVVEPEGRGPRGFRYRIVLDSTAHGAASSVDLTAEEGGLLVIARDVDGVGDDLDLIVKSAWSLAPIGVWINDHRGGFTKVDSSAYAPSIWNESPLIFSENPANHLQPVAAPSYPSCIHSLTRRYRSAPWLGEGFVTSSNFAVPSRLTVGAHQTRGPPSPLLEQS